MDSTQPYSKGKYSLEFYLQLSLKSLRRQTRIRQWRRKRKHNL